MDHPVDNPSLTHGASALLKTLLQVNRVYIKTYGCQMNERDSEAVAAMLRARGYRIVGNEADCDIMLLNTCSVRDAAEQKAIGKAGNVAARKKKQPDFVLGILGCMAQNRGAALLDALPDLDLIVGTLLGGFGFLLRAMNFPMAPFILGFVLGDMMEQNLRRALSISNGELGVLVSSPVAIGLWSAAILVVTVPMVRRRLRRSRKAGSSL